MKMNFKYVSMMACAALMAGFTSCSNDDDVDINIPTPEGDKAKMSLSFTLPSEMTRAVSAVATADESFVETIDVYVFNTGGSLVTYKQLSKSDFTGPDANGLYEQNDAFETKTGNKKIYIGINVPDAERSGCDEAVLLAKHAKIDALTGAKEFVMFSDPVEKELLGLDNNASKDYVNEVDIDVKRTAAKLTVSYGNGPFEIKWVDESDNDKELVKVTYTVDKYAVYQEAAESYLAPNYWPLEANETVAKYKTWSTLKEFDATNAPFTSGVNAQSGTDFDCVYITENAPQVTTYGNTTYAFIRTSATVNRTAQLNTDGDDIEWSTTDASYGAGVTGNADIYVFNYKGHTYLADKTNYDAILAARPLKDNDEIVNVFIYRSGYVYFQVYLNKDTNTGNDYVKNAYHVNRNQFIHVNVTGVNAKFEVFPGYPGEKSNPEKPINPGDKTPENPDPVDPTEEIDPSRADLKVNITIKPWDYKKTDTILE